jgi:NADPH:quinone reductase-like Zn-dependent oxidoreductase
MDGFAEFVCARERALARKAASMTFEEVAAIPKVAVIALQGIRDNRSYLEHNALTKTRNPDRSVFRTASHTNNCFIHVLMSGA